MHISLKFCRSSLLVSAAFLIVVACVVVLGVIPPVKADTFPLATPERAVPAFWVNAIFNLSAAVALGLIGYRTAGRTRLSTSFLCLISILIFVFSYALIDAARAFRSHGMAMHNTSLLLSFCAITGFIAALLVIITATLFPKRSERA
jgi:cytochrome c biogenesis factor